MNPALRARRLLLASAIAFPTLAMAQTPFDMSPERNEQPATEQPANRQPAGGDGFVMPFDTVPDTGAKDVTSKPGPVIVPETPAGPAAPVEPAGPAAPIQPAMPATPVEPPPQPKPEERYAGDVDRFVLPSVKLRFEGELGRKSWGVALTATQAERARQLLITRNSSIYVAPESSRLRISINDKRVFDGPLAASGDGKRDVIDLAPGVLKAGVNVVTFDIVQRHRTDCTIASTYELWTDIESPGTGFVYADEAAGNDFTTLNDLPAVGFADDGTTTLRLVLPGGDRMLAQADLLHLVQAIVLRGNFRQQVVKVETTALEAPPPGTLQIAVGTAGELATLPRLPDQAKTGPMVGFIPTDGATPTLVISGPDQDAVRSAIDRIAGTVARPQGMIPTAVDTTPWHLPMVPILTGQRRLKFSEMAVPTEEFTGRRSHDEFYIALPSDFYAEAYGEATIYLDAAYTGAVKPGSHIDVYVNGYIAANTPLTSRSGDIFRHMPISVALTHFRPGVNRVTVEAVLFTDADIACVPGTSDKGPARFALFDTSEFEMPDFARIGRWPNLAALAGAGSPYDQAVAPVQMILGREDPQTYAATATLLGRLAVSSDRVIPAVIGSSQASFTAPSIFVGTLNQFPATVLAELGIDSAAQNTWTGQSAREVTGLPFDFDPLKTPPATFGETAGTEGVYDRWQTELVNPSGVRGTWLDFENWLERTFELSLSSLALMSSSEQPFYPENRSTLIVAQSPASDDRAWTMVAAPTTEALVDSVTEITSREYWSLVSGRISSYDAASGLTILPAENQRFIFDGGFSLQNLRLVAANWLSINIVGYAIALVLLCSILGIATSALLSRLGRRS